MYVHTHIPRIDPSFIEPHANGLGNDNSCKNCNHVFVSDQTVVLFDAHSLYPSQRLVKSDSRDTLNRDILDS